MIYRASWVIISFLFVLISHTNAFAGEVSKEILNLRVAVDTVWVLIAAAMIFFMNCGFAMLESGLVRSKNTVNVLTKNVIVFAVAAIAWWASGFATMFGDGNAFFGTSGFFLMGADNSPAVGNLYQGVYSSLSWTGIPLFAKVFFQMVFVATAATIISGIVAERIKFYAYFIFSFLMAVIIYPVAGHWIWGGGWLGGMAVPFHDFAGSTAVHSVGGWAGLAGAIILGARIGKYTKDGRTNPIPGHSIPLAVLGTLVLWFGWYGFNPGSTMAADAGAISHIALTTTLAAAAGAILAIITSHIAIGKPDITMMLNGALAGLVAITAPCDGVSPFGAVIIGVVAGILVVYSILFFDRLKVDDPVGAISVHLGAGIWGTLSYGLFSTENGLFYGGGTAQLVSQVVGVISVGAYVFISSLILWSIIKAAIGMRVSKEEEQEGLDYGEHGMEAYPEFGRGSKTI